MLGLTSAWPGRPSAAQPVPTTEEAGGDRVSGEPRPVRAERSESAPASEPGQAVAQTAGDAEPPASVDDAEWFERGALVVMRALRPGFNAMRVSGGFALAEPFVGFEYARGLGGNSDLGAHYEAILGLLHFVELNLRWVPVQTGDWHLGMRLGVAYSFFGLVTDAVSLTSTLYLTPEFAASLRVSQASELVLGAGGEVDLVEWVVLDGEDNADGMIRFDAALVRFGWKTRLARELDVYVMGRLRIPREAFEVDDETFVLVPFAEFGGTWAW